MTTQRNLMLDEEERKLAAQLARIAPHGEPSADLDAQILAMAERGLAGVMPSDSRPRQRPHRWPVWLGAAASLTVVAGLVWRLEPLLHTGETVQYESPASVAADTDPNGKRQPIDYVDVAVTTDAAMPPPPPPTESAAEQKPLAQTRPAPPAPEAAAAPPEPVAPAPAPISPLPAHPATANTNAAMQADAAATKSAAADRAMAQEAPRRPVPTSVDMAPVAGSAASTRVRAPAMSPPPPQEAAAEDIVIESAPLPTADRAGFDARPPATADTPEVQRAWLARIRELRNAGQIDEARDSLLAFMKRNPKVDVPTDLRPLLPRPSPPSTPP